MIAFPNAKVNIGLDIVSRRPDGYHNLVTLFHPIPLCDVLEIVAGKGDMTTLTVTGRSCSCPVEKNLVMKAYHALAQHIELPMVDMFLRKVIPDGAGLGGGSADAAFTLMMLNQMVGSPLSQAELAGIASKLGADCAFFIYNTPMLARGVGYELEPFTSVNLAGWTMLLVKPTQSVGTGEAYSRVTPAEPVTDLAEVLTRPVEQWQGVVKNDFEPPVFSIYPEIGAVKQTLINSGAAYASMSGSGSAVYGLYPGSAPALDIPDAEIFTLYFAF